MKKIISIIASIFLLASFGIAAMTTNLFGSDTSIIYGGNAATSDITGSIDISDSLNSKLSPDFITFDKTSGIIENEVPLGGSIVEGEIREVLTDNQIPHLIDGKIEWDNGNQNKNKFNVHEEINIGDMAIRTTLDDNELNQTALTNNKGLSYKYVFEEDIGWDTRDEEEMDDLKISILGKEYQITDITSNSISVLNSNTYILKEGESIVIDGITLTITSIFNEYVEINDELIKEGKTEEIDNIRISADTIAYSDVEGRSKVILDVSKTLDENLEVTFENGDEYIEDDETWIWDIENPGEEDGYIGVKYDLDSIDPDEGIIYAGESYIFPENYAQLKFVETTKVTYNEFQIYFDEEDLYEGIENGKKLHDDAEVVIIKGKNDDSIVLEWNSNEVETNIIYLYHNDITEETEVYFRDVNEEVDDDNKIRFADSYGDSTDSQIATLIADDTEIDINIEGFALTLGDIEISLGGDKQFTYLGIYEEDAESSEINVYGNNIGTEENDVMDYYGNIIKNPENNANNDKVIIKIPSEQVYVTISVLGNPQQDTSKNIDFTISTSDLKTTNLENNLIVVGGSCINEIAAELLTESANEQICGEDFTALTGVNSGEYLYQVFEVPKTEGKIAVLIAGYNAEDTTRGVNEFLEGNFDLTVGTKFIG